MSDSQGIRIKGRRVKPVLPFLPILMGDYWPRFAEYFPWISEELKNYNPRKDKVVQESKIAYRAIAASFIIDVFLWWNLLSSAISSYLKEYLKIEDPLKLKEVIRFGFSIIVIAALIDLVLSSFNYGKLSGKLEEFLKILKKLESTLPHSDGKPKEETDNIKLVNAEFTRNTQKIDDAIHSLDARHNLAIRGLVSLMLVLIAFFKKDIANFIASPEKDTLFYSIIEYSISPINISTIVITVLLASLFAGLEIAFYRYDFYSEKRKETEQQTSTETNTAFRWLAGILAGLLIVRLILITMRPLQSAQINEGLAITVSLSLLYWISRELSSKMAFFFTLRVALIAASAWVTAKAIDPIFYGSAIREKHLHAMSEVILSRVYELGIALGDPIPTNGLSAKIECDGQINRIYQSCVSGMDSSVSKPAEHLEAVRKMLNEKCKKETYELQFGFKYSIEGCVEYYQSNRKEMQNRQQCYSKLSKMQTNPELYSERSLDEIYKHECVNIGPRVERLPIRPDWGRQSCSFQGMAFEISEYESYCNIAFEPHSQRCQRNEKLMYLNILAQELRSFLNKKEPFCQVDRQSFLKNNINWSGIYCLEKPTGNKALLCDASNSQYDRLLCLQHIFYDEKLCVQSLPDLKQQNGYVDDIKQELNYPTVESLNRMRVNQELLGGKTLAMFMMTIRQDNTGSFQLLAWLLACLPQIILIVNKLLIGREMQEYLAGADYTIEDGVNFWLAETLQRHGPKEAAAAEDALNSAIAALRLSQEEVETWIDKFDRTIEGEPTQNREARSRVVARLRSLFPPKN